MSDQGGKVIPFRRKAAASTSEEQIPANVTFKEFAQYILLDKLDLASQCLAELFSINPELAKKCAQFFHAELKQNPELFTQTMLIKLRLEEERITDVLVLLHQCFGATGLEGIELLNGLHKRFPKVQSK